TGLAFHRGVGASVHVSAGVGRAVRREVAGRVADVPGRGGADLRGGDGAGGRGHRPFAGRTGRRAGEHGDRAGPDGRPRGAGQPGGDPHRAPARRRLARGGGHHRWLPRRVDRRRGRAGGRGRGDGRRGRGGTPPRRLPTIGPAQDHFQEERMTVHSGRFDRQVVLVTGGGSGIGRAVAVAFAAAGATVVVAGRDRQRLAGTCKQIHDAGGVAVPVPVDVTRRDQVARLVADVVSRHGGLHIGVNNAGIIGDPAPVADLTEESWDRLLATSLTGLWVTMKHQLVHMRANGGGVIVNIASSVGAHLTLPTLGAYAATKAAVSALTRTAAREHIRDGIRINAVSPGPVDAPMSRLPGETDGDRDARLAQVLPI